MSDELIAITLLWLFIFVYAIAAAIDFGAGFWSMIYLYREDTSATSIANRYLSPSWEVTNVFVVLIVVGLVSFFPGATATLGTVLLIPFSVGLLLLAIRSAFLVWSHTVERLRNLLIIISGSTGLFIPVLLILVLPITYGGLIEQIGNYDRLHWGMLFSTPSVYTYMLFAGTSTLFLSSLMLSDYSHVSNDWSAYRVYRRDAIAMGPVSMLSSVLVIVTMRTDAPWLYNNLSNIKTWILLSICLFVIGYAALFFPQKTGHPQIGRPRVAVVSIVLQYMMAATGYGIAHLPYIVYPNVTIQSSFTAESNFHALFASYVIGFLILTPGFIFFWRVFMKDKQYLRQK